MKRLHISDKALHKVSLSLENKRIKGAAVFPFFNDSGQVKQVMIILPKANEVFMVPFEESLVEVSFWGNVKLSMDFDNLRSFAYFDTSQISTLFHYDSRWRLSHKRFLEYWAKELIEQSNCFELFKDKIDGVHFSRDLLTVSHFSVTSGPLTFRSISPEQLLTTLPTTDTDAFDRDIDPEKSVESKNDEWALDPIWNAWGTPDVDKR